MQYGAITRFQTFSHFSKVPVRRKNAIAQPRRKPVRPGEPKKSASRFPCCIWPATVASPRSIQRLQRFISALRFFPNVALEWWTKSDLCDRLRVATLRKTHSHQSLGLLWNVISSLLLIR